MRIFALIFLITSFAFGWDKFYPSFHAKVVNVAKGDVLNIRAKPSYKSKKLGFLKPGEELQVEYCLENPRSTWCKIYPAVEINVGVEENAANGWVNARFLHFMNKGYVNIKNRKSNCDYLLKCKANRCLILTYDGLEWVKRSLIGIEKGQKATSLPIEEEASGIVDGATFCFNHYRDKTLWAKAKKYSNSKSSNKGAKDSAKEIVNAIKHKNIAKLKSYIHPTRGVLISYYPNFYRVNKHFSKAEFSKFYNSSKRLYWGVSEGRGDKIYLSLKGYINTLSSAVKRANKITKSDPLTKGFDKRANLIAYDFREPSPKVGWKGVYVVLQKYNGKCYLVGLFYNRWSI